MHVSRCVVLLAAGLLTGCADYMNNRDSITLGVGNANAANIGIHTAKAFPPDAHNTDIDVAGVKVQQAYNRYLVGPSGAAAQSGYEGNCEYADDTDAAGNRCGGRAAEVRPGGHEPPPR